MDWLAFAGSIIGGIIGGLFTFLGVKLTIKYDKEKEKKAEQLKAEETKPRLEIVHYAGFDSTKDIKTHNNDCNVLVASILDYKEVDGYARFYYNEKALDENNLDFVEYVFKNTGLTEITDVCITSNLQKDTAVFALERREYYIKENFLNYDVWSNKKFIKPGDTITVRIYYVKDQVVVSNLGFSPLSMWLLDINNRQWRQPLSAPMKETDVPYFARYSDFKNAIDFKKGIECFRNPMMW